MPPAQSRRQNTGRPTNAQRKRNTRAKQQARSRSRFFLSSPDGGSEVSREEFSAIQADSEEAGRQTAKTEQFLVNQTPLARQNRQNQIEAQAFAPQAALPTSEEVDAPVEEEQVPAQQEPSTLETVIDAFTGKTATEAIEAQGGTVVGGTLPIVPAAAGAAVVATVAPRIASLLPKIQKTASLAKGLKAGGFLSTAFVLGKVTVSQRNKTADAAELFTGAVENLGEIQTSLERGDISPQIARQMWGAELRHIRDAKRSLRQLTEGFGGLQNLLSGAGDNLQAIKNFERGLPLDNIAFYRAIARAQIGVIPEDGTRDA